ncbi:MAG: phosphatase PAP2 family protein [Oligoflexia bacterium]|nr:phosphatase PAP2 family protein [Oligoflexia bacterium]
MKKFILMLLTVGLLTGSLHAESDTKESQSWVDLKETFFLLFEGAYTQFQTKSNLYYMGAAVPSVWYAFENDDRIQTRYGGTEIKNIVDHVGDAGVVFNFPLLHLGFYYYGRNTNNNHHIQFAKEYFAAMYLALAESGLLSYVSIHNRPVTGDESFWEKEFRGDSSWPSGHVVPYMTLFFKTLQFYGPAWSTIPLALSILSSMQRVQDNKHWLSDVTASFFLSAFASEGVRKAAKYKKNHPFYRWVFENDARVGMLRYQNAIGPQVSWSF